MATRPNLKISKTDAAKRQIETAIRLWFFSCDPVSVHTLTAAAHQILHDIGKKRGAPTILREPQGIRPEYKKQIHELVRRNENFFKHADEDPDAILDFNPEATEMYMLDVVVTYESLTQEVSPIQSVFKSWIFLQKPNLMNEIARKKMEEDTRGLNMTGISKAEFFTDVFPLAMKSGIA